MADRERIEELLGAANEASGFARTIWATFLLFGTYLAIAVGSTGHRDLLLQSPVALPLLQNVRVDLVTFFWVAPLFYLIYHLYTLVAYYILAGKLHAFNAALERSGLPEAEQLQLRQRVHPSLMAQSLSGPRRGWLSDRAMGFTLWITLVVLPVVLMIGFQVRFLPYHDVFWTWVQRLLLADLAMVWTLWPLVSHPSGRMGGVLRDLGGGLRHTPGRLAARAGAWGRVAFGPLKEGMTRGEAMHALRRSRPPLSHPAMASRHSVQAALLMAALTLGVALFSIGVATVPGEAVERLLLRLAGAPAEGLLVTRIADRPVLAPTALLFDGPVDPVRLRPATPLSRNLVVVNERLAPAEGQSLVLRGRDLRHAMLTGSDLRGADLTAADLEGALLTGANLTGAVLECADPVIPSGCANLRGATLAFARMRGASLEGANLQGALLDSARLEGASLYKADLRGASLTRARLQGAFLDSASLEAASLISADLQGASLKGAVLRGASLGPSRLHGAALDGADLSGASLRRASLWRAGGWLDVSVVADLRDAEFEPLPEKEAAELREALDRRVPQGVRRRQALDRFDAGILDPWAAERELAARKLWQAMAAVAEQDDYADRLATVLGALACGQADAPAVAAGIAQRLIRRADPPAVQAQVARWLLSADCAAAGALPAPMREALTGIAGAD